MNSKTFAVFANTIEELKEKNKHLFSRYSIFRDSRKAGSIVWIHTELPKFHGSKTLSVDGLPFDHNAGQKDPEIIGEWFDLDKLYIEGYKAGDCTCKTPKLEWRHFTFVQRFNETRHPKTKISCVTVLAWTKTKAPTLLICKYK